MAKQTNEVLVWDRGIRLFHWALALLIPLQVSSVYLLDNMTLHFYLGYTLIALLGWRILWGFIGPDTARFSSFVRSPAAVLRYLNGQERFDGLGHNPMGGWSVMSMLTILLIQVLSGLFASDGFDVSGPLAVWIGDALSEWLGALHFFSFMALSAMILIHLCAILVYSAHGENLVTPMITGKRRVPSSSSASPGKQPPSSTE